MQKYNDQSKLKSRLQAGEITGEVFLKIKIKPLVLNKLSSVVHWLSRKEARNPTLLFLLLLRHAA